MNQDEAREIQKSFAEEYKLDTKYKAEIVQCGISTIGNLQKQYPQQLDGLVLYPQETHDDLCIAVGGLVPKEELDIADVYKDMRVVYFQLSGRVKAL